MSEDDGEVEGEAYAADWAIVDCDGNWESYGYDRERAERRAENLSDISAFANRAPFEVVPADQASPDLNASDTQTTGVSQSGGESGGE